MNNIEKVYYILTKRLSKNGFVPNWIIPIKIYKDTPTLLKMYCKIHHKNYIDTVNNYSEDYKRDQNNHITGYIKTKYFSKVKYTYKTEAFKINAIADIPIRISYKHVNYRPLKEIAFLLLHEWGHHYNKKSHEFWNEKKADKFAIRWVRKLIKEGLINE